MRERHQSITTCKNARRKAGTTAVMISDYSRSKSIKKKPKQNDDRDGNTQQPKQNSAKHSISPLFVVRRKRRLSKRVPSLRSGSLKGQHSRQHGVGVPFHSHFPPDFRYPAVRSDQKCRSFNAHIFAPEHEFLRPNSVGFDRCTLLVGCEIDGQFVFGPEFAMLLDAIRRNADDGCSNFAEVRLQPGELNGFGRAGFGVVLPRRIAACRSSR